MTSSKKEALLKKVGDERGFRYGLHDFLADVDPEYLKKLDDWIEFAYLRQKHLDRKTKELIIIATCCACHDTISHIQMHMKAAVEAGASKEEIMESITLQYLWAGAVGNIIGLEAWRGLFAPELPTILKQTA